MALTAAERQRRRREKLKQQGKYEEYKSHHREIAQKSRDKKKDMLENLSQQRREIFQREQREATRKRVAKCKALKKEKEKESVVTPPFVSAVAFSRATAKRALKNALPKSPRRRKAVHRKLYESELDGSSISSSTDSPKRSDALSDELVELVQTFYQRDDIS
ncbi:Hypothetical predicted protein [Paramuricea clavata]|uniref:Uncharacterized protein n=1 Tax=Paramuricea clavata TaxID=317549 RepID=A0A6S7GGZ7_PARCT|nr:Hypothetical predicted protein [Paramuricea clavata]